MTHRSPVHPLADALITAPIFRADSLGQPIPNSPFAVSVSLPTWNDVIGYEEKDPRVVNAMTAGYPRFFLNSHVTRLADSVRATEGCAETEGCLLFPSSASAMRCVEFIRRRRGVQSRTTYLSDYRAHAVFFPNEAAEEAKGFWQHCGEGLSGRHAAAAERGSVAPKLDEDALAEVVGRLADIYDVPTHFVHLFPAGMAAIWASFRVLKTFRPAGPTIQFGFPYVDTLKLHETVVESHHFLPHGGPSDLARLSTILATDSVAGVYCEIPSNPLLNIPDVLALRTITKEHGVPLIVDDTLAAFFNLDVLPQCDAVVCSLTKYFSGVGDVMGGALIVNPNSSCASRLQSALDDEPLDRLYSEDVQVLAERSRTVEERVRTINRRAESLADHLREHPAVAAVNYPSREDPRYSSLMRNGGGLGGLLSFTLKRPETAPAVFDSLPFCKGPNLGMDYTLCCPFTILAHYDELDFVKRCGLAPDLIRVAVGSEPVNVLIKGFDHALGGGVTVKT